MDLRPTRKVNWLIRDASVNVVQQFIHGTQYIDELIMAHLKNQGDLYVNQDANSEGTPTEKSSVPYTLYAWTLRGSITP